MLSSDELGELAITFNKMAGQLNTYRQNTTEQIIRLHRTMEAALASFSDPVFIMDRYTRIELSNRAAEELSAKLLLDGALPARLATAVDTVLQRNADFLPDSFDEVITLRVKGTERAFLPRLHIMREADAKPVGVAVVLHDVTRFRLLDDAKTNLVATVSHELKTPLTSVRMVLHLLLEKVSVRSIRTGRAARHRPEGFRTPAPHVGRPARHRPVGSRRRLIDEGKSQPTPTCPYHPR